MAVKNRPKYMKIIEAAVDVIAENGFHQAQVSKIAKRAGVADGTIYIYFKNKEDILISLFSEKMGEFIEKIQEEIKDQPTAKEKMTTLVGTHFFQLAADRNMAIVTQLELRQSNKEIRMKINDTLKNYTSLIDALIEEGKLEGVFRTDLDVRLARQMVFGTIDETVTNWVMNDHKFDLVALADPVANLLLNGLSH
ncbi:TetR/AcrR family transcriptional regulator [Pullulanibacillus sp. KACC 23026]|uniref:TetR/AcrR family transcriptional regulator n=1 Tax=Pullulanibacillus sp. KACC 23026 TaxID=3028315 RepID=UPI0023AF7B71|nr:TetR/AcrR family transcriptional regulator [Pullulanibacillus sp. KACC 23026]WEG13938.1 TetR/AcrR family transcriptional regulator [Pullulanibacillus sp. KACC 23026]